MATKKTVLKLFIIIILAIFLLSTGLISVLYLGGNKNVSHGTGDLATGAIIETGTVVIVSGSADSGVAELPNMTNEEASQKLQQLLSGIKK